MSTEFYNRNWRMPKSSNSSKVSNYSMSFDGSSEYIDIGNPTELQLTNDISVSGWFKTSSTSVMNLFTKRASGVNNWAVYMQSGYIYFWVSVDGTSVPVQVQSASTLNDGNWHFFTGVREGTSLKLYIDNLTPVSGTIASGSLTNPNGTVMIGKAAVNSFLFNGSLDHVAIFDYALSASQVTSLYGNSSDGVGNPMAITEGRKPISYYPIGDYAAFNGSEYLVNNGALQDYVFDITGSGQLIDLGGSNLWNNILVGTNRTGVATLSSWVKGPFGSYNRIWEMGAAGQDLIRVGTNQKLYYRFGSGSIYRRWTVPSGVDLDSSSWLHIVLVFKAGSVTDASGTAAGNGVADIDLFINGDLCSQDFLSAGASASTWGSSNYGIKNYSGEQLTERSNVQIWNSELTSSEITTLYNNGTPYMGTQPQSSNLQGWWKLDASATFDGSNWSIPDDSSNSNTGTSSGMTAANLVQSTLNITTPYSRFALDLDGTGDRINYGVNSVFDFGTSDFAWSFWLNYESHTNYAGIFFTGSSSSTYRLKFQTSGQILFMQNADGDSQVADLGTDITGTGWHHIVLSRNSGTITTFLDGSQVDTDSRAGNINQGGGDFIVGANGTSYLNGQLSNISIWNTALTLAQVTELYNNKVPTNLNSHSAYSNLISWWQLGENMSFDSNVWTVLNEITTGPNGQGFNIAPAESAIVNGVGTSANGLSDGMGGADNIIGDAPYSTANAVSYGMGVDALSTSVPS